MVSVLVAPAPQNSYQKLQRLLDVTVYFPTAASSIKPKPNTPTALGIELNSKPTAKDTKTKPPKYNIAFIFALK